MVNLFQGWTARQEQMLIVIQFIIKVCRGRDFYFKNIRTQKSPAMRGFFYIIVLRAYALFCLRIKFSAEPALNHSI